MALRQFWFLDQYKNPTLTLDSARITAQDEADLLLDDAEMSFQVTMISPQERDSALRRLQALCKPDRAAWEHLRTLPDGHPLAGILDALYVAGYVTEAAAEVSHADLEQAWRRTVDHYLAGLLRHAEALDAPGRAQFARHVELMLVEVRRLLQFGDAALPADVAPGTLLPQADLWSNQNFFLLTMTIQLRYARRNNALGIGLIYQLLSRLPHRLGLTEQAPAEDLLRGPVSSYMVNVYHGRDAEACLYAFTEFLRAAGTPQAARITIEPEIPERARAGINFALASEHHARACSALLGPSQFFEALQNPENHLRLAPACYLQEYFVNYRFVETITPMITKRLTPRLKEMFWRYYSEEIGHEQFELNTCKQLGIDETFIASHLPLPMTQAFCDTFSYLAECEEIGYLASVMVTEGMPGEPSLINQILSHSPVLSRTFNSASLTHEELNQELAHQFLSRIFLSQIPSIDPAMQQRALNILSYVVELNFRAWEDLHQRVMVEGQAHMATAVWPGYQC